MPAIQPVVQQEAYLYHSISVYDENAYFWYHAFAPMLELMLEHSGHSEARKLVCLEFFASHIAPFLGPRPLSSKPFRSFMTSDHTPVESSLQWKSSSAYPLTRFATDIIPYDGSESPSATVSRALVMADNLYHYSFGPNPMNLAFYLDLFTDMARELVAPNAPEELIHQCPSGASQTFFGFDIGATNTKVKAYFLPSLRSLMEGKPRVDIITAMFKKLGKFSAWIAILKYIKTLPIEEQPEPFIVSIDCLPREEARFKVYFRYPATDVVRLFDYLSLGGKVRLTERHAEGIRALWQAAAGTAGRLRGSPVANKSYGLCLYYDFKMSSPVPLAKCYIPVQSWARHDMQIAQFFTAWLKEFCNPAAASRYVDLVSQLCDRPLEKGKGFHTYIGIAPSKDGGCEATSYYNINVFR